MHFHNNQRRNKQWRSDASIDTLQFRAKLYRDIRQFFYERNVLEVDTPALSTSCVTDPYVENIEVAITNSHSTYNHASLKSSANGLIEAKPTHYLQTSPEYAMKRLLAQGIGDCYQLGKAFRHEEQGRHHRHEFTMLEWYRCNWNATQLCEEVLLLLEHVGVDCSNVVSHSFCDWFQTILGIDPLLASHTEISNVAEKYGINNCENIRKNELLDALLCLAIEPAMQQYPIAVITDFPAERAALAKLSKNNPQVAERFEIYIHGLELVNGYHELTDANVLLQRFNHDNELRQQQGKICKPIDYALLAAMENGMPACAGVSLGVDRLIMALLQLDHIDKATV